MENCYGSFETFPSTMTNEEVLKAIPLSLEKMLKEFEQKSDKIKLDTLKIEFKHVNNYGLPDDAIREKAVLSVKVMIDD